MIYASTKQTLSERGRQQFCLKHKIHSKKIVHRIVQIVTSLSACLSKLKEIDEDARVITGKAWLYRLNIPGLNTKAEYTI